MPASAAQGGHNKAVLSDLHVTHWVCFPTVTLRHFSSTSISCAAHYRSVYDYALYKSTFYLLHLLTTQAYDIL